MVFVYFLALLVMNYASSLPTDVVVETRNTRVNDDLYRIPTDAIEVKNYKIEFSVDKNFFDQLRYEGLAEISFTNKKFENEIKLHASEMNFTAVVLEDAERRPINIINKEYAINETNEFLTLTTEESLQPDSNYTLRLNYSALLRTELNGFYRSSYLNSEGERVFLGTTQFQTTSARKAFPCFDEPFYKATFDVKFRYPKNFATGDEYRVIGNTVDTTEEDETDPEFKITTLATTPRMSTYLVAFIISDFTCTSGELIDENIPHYICSRRETEPMRELAVSAGPKLANAMENYTGVKYSVSTIGKIHQAAIPDFSAGAMENWGLVTYREPYLLWDPEQSTNQYKKYVITIVAHELSHFWFGNLVTCHWWSDTFLNEGFATYFEYHAAHEVYPEMELDKQFVIDEMWPVLVNDASLNSAALSSPASSPSEVSGRFSSISYNKGGSVFRMVRHFMGHDNFKQGLKEYLNDRAFQPVTPAHLWSALQSYPPTEIPANISDVMENWVEKPGFPVITVSAKGLDIVLTQKRYLSSRNDTDNTTWWVPITYTTGSDYNKFENTTARFWLRPSSSDQTIKNALQNESDWIILNNQHVGYYRVDYSDQLWRRIESVLKLPGFGGIHDLNRAQIVNDLYNFARYGYRRYADVVRIYEFLRRDTSYYSWNAAISAYNAMISRIENQKLRKAFETHILESIATFYNTLPFHDHRDHDQVYTMKKVLVIPFVCRLGLKDCADNAYEAFIKFKDNDIPINKNLKATIYCNGLRYSKNIEEDWNFIWERYQNVELASESSTSLTALGCTTDPDTIEKFLHKAITSNSGISTSNAASAFSTVYTNNPAGADLVLSFLINNFETMQDYFGSSNTIRSIFSGLGSRLTRQEHVDKLQKFIDSTELGNHTSAATSALNAAKLAIAAIEEFEQELNLYFKFSVAGGASDRVVTVFMTICLIISAISVLLVF